VFQAIPCDKMRPTQPFSVWSGSGGLSWSIDDLMAIASVVIYG
jgi:hypothetical protein